MNQQDAIEFLSNMADSYENECELWDMEAHDETGDYEESMKKAETCNKKVDAIRTVLNALDRSSVTILKNRVHHNWGTNKQEEKIIAKFYRRHNGYPAGHGEDIAMALRNAATTKNKKYTRFDGKKCEKVVLNNRNWCQHFLKELCKQDIDIEFIDNDDKQCGDFTYIITGEYDTSSIKADIDDGDYLNRINVKVYRGNEQEKLLFDGNGLDYLNWSGLR